MSGTFGEGVSDVGRSAYANIGDTYQAFLRGETAPQATMTGTMETTTVEQDIAPAAPSPDPQAPDLG